MFVSIAVATITAAALLRLAGCSIYLPSQYAAMAFSRTPEEAYKEVKVLACQPESNLSRLQYGYTPGASVFGWPAKGGLYVLTASAVEVEFLGYGRFENVPRPSVADPSAAAEEEAHCNKSKYPSAAVQSYSLGSISDSFKRHRCLLYGARFYIDLIIQCVS